MVDKKDRDTQGNDDSVGQRCSGDGGSGGERAARNDAARTPEMKKKEKERKGFSERRCSEVAEQRLRAASGNGLESVGDGSRRRC